ncbi:hypothetical protein HPP92_015745 [Vanilla planifolia]|uniref:RRM domain-containing protein n=1 Tax=Vanilla planifolia TaxID=51239 RepID=A0A835QEW2_VANPL|nr:hypothetical protein HPP92_016356 [Vanilla planifolia]KAG0471199.1 hypothetical protein HPP92_015745 [Vanilla planifolia]
MANSPQYYRSRFGDTTMRKVFVGGLAWETPTEELRRYFEQFGDILEAVVIADKNTGRSKGYGFVTFRDPESAWRSVADPNPLIDGRRANCNIAALGRTRPSTPRGGPQQEIGLPRGPMGVPYARLPAPMPPPTLVYPTPYGYVTYATDFGYQQGAYNSQFSSQYYHQMYGPTASSTAGHPQYYHPMSLLTQSPRAGFPLQSLQSQPYTQSFGHHPTAHVELEGSFFQLQQPPLGRQSLTMPDSQVPQTSLTSGGNNESSDD